LSTDSLVFWLFVAAWLVVAVLLGFVQLPRIVREAMRIVKRVRALDETSPLPLQLAKAEADVGRLGAALERIPVLQQRAADALLRIRTAPLVPPALIALGIRIGREIQAFRRELRAPNSPR
jgi:Sec-independent protein translocase protein TatA